MTPYQFDHIQEALFKALKVKEGATWDIAAYKAVVDMVNEAAGKPPLVFRHVSTPEDVRDGRLILELVPEESDPLLMEEFIAAQYLASDRGRAMMERLAA